MRLVKLVLFQLLKGNSVVMECKCACCNGVGCANCLVCKETCSDKACQAIACSTIETVCSIKSCIFIDKTSEIILK